MEKTINLVPLYTILLIFSSFVATSSYYSRFGIDIYNYIEFSDLLIASLPTFKNIFIAFFIICSMSFSSFIVGYLQAMFASPRKKIFKSIVENLRKDSNAIPNNNHKRSIRQMIWKFETDKIGFHLITELAEISQPRFRRLLSRQELWRRLSGIALIVCVLIYVTYAAGKLWIEYYRSVKLEQESFYTNPKETIAYLIVIPISFLFFYGMFFGGKYLWRAVFKPFFKTEIIPIIIIGIFTITSMLSNYADYLNIKNGKTDYYRIYLKESVIATEPNGFRYIGRTKNFVFLIKTDKVSSINIADADSIIVKTSNRIR